MITRFEPFHDHNKTNIFSSYSKWGDVKSLKILIKHGADVDVKADDGSTAIHVALSYGNSINLIQSKFPTQVRIKFPLFNFIQAMTKSLRY